MKHPAPVLMIQDVWSRQAAPTDSSFLTLAPSKHIDLRTTIY